MTLPEPQYQAQPFQQPPEVWTLTLNRYQRDNLLYLLNCINSAPHGRDDMKHWNTGDWHGEIWYMLGKRGWFSNETSYVIDEGDHPNPVYFPKETDEGQ